MAKLDEHLQKRRIAAALPWVPEGAHVLDVGCADGSLFTLAAGRIGSGVGIDPIGDATPPPVFADDRYEFRRGSFPASVQPGETFDAVVMLAVVEHVPEPELPDWADAVSRVLRPAGRLVITTPSPYVDHILHVGIRLRVLDGMEAHQHHGFDPKHVPAIFSVADMRLEKHRRFQLGLNNLFVFAKAP
ncbi:MAG: methyltransferase domain-containing protein [Actinomycetota bacterium]|nr:methyltransferase domain-containing protein [Actinomycetota bacterium]